MRVQRGFVGARPSELASSSKRVRRLPLDDIALSGIPGGEVKDNQVAHLGSACHEAGLSCCQMIPAAGFLGINVQVGRFAVEHVCVASEGNDFRFILFIEPSIDNVGDLLPA